MNGLVDEVAARSREIETTREVRVRIETLSRGTPTQFNPKMVQRLSEVVQTVGYESLLLPSGAGHDTQCLAEMAEVGMLFVPSVDGVSHSPEEFTHPEDVIAGVRALAACWARVSSNS
jgi:acetylornithine deacetylase/succinyl-diaminopimelate desuccinylase-like protein